MASFICYLLLVVVKTPAAPPLEPTGFIGVDLGIVRIAKANRKTRSRFQCASRGHVVNADTNAAINIAAKADVMRPRDDRNGCRERSCKPPALAGGS